MDVPDAWPALNDPITENEVKKCINISKNNKAVQTDNITNEHIKHTQDLLCPSYVKLFNTIFISAVWLQQWLVGCTVPVYKGHGDTEHVNN